MSALYGDNYTKAFINVPAEQANQGEYGGGVKLLLDRKSGAIAADTIAIGKLPKGAIILSVNSIGLGAGGSVDVDPLDIATDQQIVTATVGAGPSADIIVWVTYSLV